MIFFSIIWRFYRLHPTTSTSSGDNLTGLPGIVAPKVLERLNRIRNRIEDDYYCPTLEEANDFIGVVELFVYATLSFVVVFPDESLFLIGDGANEIGIQE